MNPSIQNKADKRFPFLPGKFSIILYLIILMAGCKQEPSHPLHLPLSDIHQASGMPGFTVSLVNKDSVIYQGGFGYADREKQIPMTVNTNQNVASISKTMVGVALAIADEQDIIKFDTKINDLLPFEVTNPNSPDAPITIWHLATHTSGLEDQFPDHLKITFSETPDFKNIKYSDEEKELIDIISQNTEISLRGFLELLFTPDSEMFNDKTFSKNKPGTNYAYSSIGTALAALIIELETGMRFHDFTQKMIFEPLQMNDTGWNLKLDNPERNAAYYAGENTVRVPDYKHRTYPVGGLRTTTADLSKFLIDIIKGYSGTGRLMYNTSYRKILGKQFNAKNMPAGLPKEEPNQGLFWSHRVDGMIGHTGGGLGVSSFMFFDPETGIGKIFLTNSEIDTSQKMADGFMNAWHLLSEYSKQPAPVPQ